jgi:hypothetical protein
MTALLALHGALGVLFGSNNRVTALIVPLIGIFAETLLLAWHVETYWQATLSGVALIACLEAGYLVGTVQRVAGPLPGTSTTTG